MSRRIYNLKKQPTDERDLKFAAVEAVELPSKVDLRDKCPAVFD